MVVEELSPMHTVDVIRAVGIPFRLIGAVCIVVLAITPVLLYLIAAPDEATPMIRGGTRGMLAWIWSGR